MPKVVAPRSSARGPLADGAVKIKTVDRGRNKSGRPRAANVKTSVVLPPPKRKPAPSPPPVSLDLHPGDSGSEDEQEIQLPTQKGPSRAVSTKLAEWLPFREQDLDELLIGEGLGGRSTVCVLCQRPGGFRCEDCFGEDLVCKTCLLAAHFKLPLHLVERWNGQFFLPEPLAALGLVMQLGHKTGQACPYPSRRYQLTVFDLSGVHQTVVRYCGCTPEDPNYRRRQLLRRKWFPATLARPHTVFTFKLLDFFHQLQSHNKTNLFDFYNTIVHLSDSAGLSPEIHRYNEISLVYKAWVHLHLVKRGGGAHRHGGVASLPDGSMAVECPGCPHPGRNVDDESLANDWKSTLFIALDACFKLKLKDRSFVDPDLGTRLAYMVEDKKYQLHLAHALGITLPPDSHSCGSMLHAVNDAHTKSSRGYLATGVVISSCRHMFVRPNGAADLQRGERYINTDYAFMSSIIPDLLAGIRRLFVSYDVMCQWGVYLQRRLNSYLPPLNQDLKQLTTYRTGVPKFHLVGHGASCQVTYNIALKDEVGLTHGEGVETVWAGSGQVATWSKESGPSARHQVLDDHWGAWNWRKVVNSRVNLRKSLEKAWKWGKIQRQVADSFDAMISEDTFRQWTDMVAAYKIDPTKPNPFEEPEAAASLTSLRREFLQEETDARKRGVIYLHETTPTTFLRRALDVEEKQRILRSRYRNVATGSIWQQESLQDQRKSLTQAIDELRSPQRVYMPGCSETLDNIDPASVIDAPESTKLWLPSAIPAASRDTWCLAGIALIEFRLRYAQAVDALDNIRRLSRLLQGLHLQKLKHPLPTQGVPATRSRSVFEGLNIRIAHISARYRDARVALLRLHPSGTWSSSIRELTNADIRGPGPKDDPTSRVSRSQFVPTWIWLVKAPPTPSDLPGSPPPTHTEPLNQNPATSSVPAPTAEQGVNVSKEEIEACLLVDWARAHERAKRFEEEVELNVEEMRRTLVFFAWKASNWERLAEERANSDAPPSEATLQGLRAYAYCKSAMYREMVKAFVSDWDSCLRPRDLGSDWLSGYSGVIVPRKGWNKIPSIIPKETELEVDSGILSDQDDVFEQPPALCTEQDDEFEVHDNFVQMVAEG